MSVVSERGNGRLNLNKSQTGLQIDEWTFDFVSRSDKTTLVPAVP